MKNPRGRRALSMIAALTCLAITQSANAQEKKPFQLGVEERGYIQEPGGNMNEQYPSPQMVQTPTYSGNVQKKEKPAPKKKAPALQSGVSDSAQSRPPLQAGVRQDQVLPQGFMGSWLVSGLRKEIKAQPQFQAAIPTIFQEQTQDVWTISGSPGGYAFSNNQGVKSAIYVDKVQNGTAFIRYQHPIKNTMAKEAIVMEMVPGGMQFNGLERISIVKQGEPGPRAEVTYQLMGRRR
jgi:hypothetical protein